MESETEARVDLATLIEGSLDEIEQRWLSQALADIAGTDVDLTEFRDGIREYVSAIVHGMRSDEVIEPRADAAWGKIAEQHGITRVRLGFDIGELVHEFIILRRILSGIASRATPPAEAFRQGQRLADFIEAAIARSVHSYVQSRDFAARRVEAEHIAFITHELRNPLTTAKLALSALRVGKPEVTQGDRHVALIERSHRRLEQLIDQVLQVERFDAGEVFPRATSVKLGDVVDESVRGGELLAREKRLSFSASYDPEVEVYLDRDLTRSAVNNLVDNAVKYTESGSVELRVLETPSELEFHVRDSCQGLSSAELSIIFEPFRRGSTRTGGTGLGLSIARRAIEAQGGEIHAESPGHRGCHFWIKLPKASH